MKESARGDRKGYFSIAMQRRTAGCSKSAVTGNIKHPGADAQTTTATPRLGPVPEHGPGPIWAHLHRHRSGLGQLCGWGKGEFIITPATSLLAAVRRAAACGSISAGCIVLRKGYVFFAIMEITHNRVTTSSQNSNYSETISKSLSASLLWS